MKLYLDASKTKAQDTQLVTQQNIDDIISK